LGYQAIFGHQCSEKDNQWEINIEWSSGETSWEPVLMIHKDEPLHLAEHTKANDLTCERGLARACKVQYHKLINMFKFGVEIPRSVKHALELDCINHSSKWQDAMNAEIGQHADYDTFFVLDEGVTNFKDKAVYELVLSHMVFEVKFYLHHKA
jgi:hypothetical protein